MSELDRAWVERGALHNRDGSCSASCHHRGSGACGGCYMRLYIALTAIENGGDAKAIVAETWAAMRADKLARAAKVKKP